MHDPDRHPVDLDAARRDKLVATLDDLIERVQRQHQRLKDDLARFQAEAENLRDQMDVAHMDLAVIDAVRDVLDAQAQAAEDAPTLEV